jgi:hypothetical protein
MATLAEIYALKNTGSILFHRFVGGCIEAAWDIINESDQTANHTNRLAFAKKVIADPVAVTMKYYLYFLSNATIQMSGEGSTDNDIQFVVNSFIDIVSNLEAA